MKRNHFLSGLYLFAALNAPAAVLYVDLNSANPTPPYTDWSTAATNIQDAVDAAVAGDQILVTNGVYQTGGKAVFGTMTNRVAVDKAVAVQSVNGPAVTIIQGHQIPGVINDDGAIRCVYLTNGASLSGFAMTHGATRSAGDFSREQCGGGVWCESATVAVSNCAIWYNSAADSGGGAFQGTLKKCTLYNNTSDHEGGGAYGSALYNCVLGANSSGASSGGASRSTLNNCLVQFNNGGVLLSTLTNCTVVANVRGGAADCTLINSIVVGNGGENFSGVTFMAYCCTTPYPPGPGGNITEAPMFVDWYGANFRLQSNSPCIDHGVFMLTGGSKDLDGRQRFRLNGVDMGAYEFQPGVSGQFIGWLSGYSLPTDGTADYADSDNDHLNNWQEWIAGTVPTDDSSTLRMLNPTTGTSGVTVSWQSVSNRTYSLERAINLGMQPAFSPAASNIVGQAGTTSFTDTNATGPGPFFYRVGIQH